MMKLGFSPNPNGTSGGTNTVEPKNPFVAEAQRRFVAEKARLEAEKHALVVTRDPMAAHLSISGVHKHFASEKSRLDDSWKRDLNERDPLASYPEIHAQHLMPQSTQETSFGARNPIAGDPKNWPKVWPGDAVPKIKENNLHGREQKFLEEFNKYRAKFGLKPVKLNDDLTEAADKHSDYQAGLNSCNHYGPKGQMNWFTGRAKAAGYKGKAVNENVAAGQNSIEEAIWSWHMSPGHRKTMLDPNITEIGIGFRRGNKGPYGGERWTLMTGRS